MHLTRIGTTPRRRAPVRGGPTMEVLVAAEIQRTSPSGNGSV
jgi:hypothetical protein